MKKLLLLFMTCATVFSVNAQVNTPQPSPAAKLEQKVGLTDVTLEYSRPSVKGRIIFGDLVPYSKMWRTGANKNTIITFSTEAEIDGYKLKPGSYAIFTEPGESLWKVYFYSDTENWGTPKKWDETNVVAVTSVKAHSVPFNVETFTLDINSITNSGANIELIWEKTYIAIPFTVPTDDAVLASINDVLGGSPKASDYYAAASYYLQEGKSPKQAMEWIDKAVEMTKEKPLFYYIRKQSLIHAKAGDSKGAIAAARKSLELAKIAGNDDYVKMNQDSLDEWLGE
ncbi:DUF2911 domain-containing protein [Tamlana sp. 2_MG-2023]|uniref:DUF2911 domain-containing protein n=1 Tax=unclassified Tamlana TaxID=2614803 RepID=UPI0026E1BEF4|nr:MULTISPECIES: DUF2911 domain-containing protein [unclassified Tamlana]MDO6759184.1 DUF2911 domain-containing protein [Tamlana sp. 2_MG-2023]MDO6790677.1 DUF2911 domain-containing protein [Tamlana sp. 1_MG-2023]